MFQVSPILFYLLTTIFLWWQPYYQIPVQAAVSFQWEATTKDSDITIPFQVYTPDTNVGSKEDPNLVYVPVQTTTQNGSSFSIYGTLPLVDSTYSKTPSLSLSFSHQDGSGKSIFVTALNTDNKYQFINETKVDNNTITRISLNFTNFCIHTTDCKLKDSTEISSKQNLYVVVLNEGKLRSSSDPIDPAEEGSEYAGGIYLQIKFKSLSAPGALNFTSVSRGDQQAVLKFDEGNVIDSILKDHYKTLSFSFSSLQSAQSYQEAKSKNSSIVVHNAVAFGEIKRTNLTNGSVFHLTIALQDKFGYVSSLPETRAVTPMEIQAFLEDQSCYFLAAGFQNPHPVLNYFRTLRDQQLLPHPWGKKFVHWYYRHAPQYAPYIYRSEILSFMVRSVAWFMYLLLHYRYIFCIILIPAAIMLRKKEEHSL